MGKSACLINDRDMLMLPGRDEMVEVVLEVFVLSKDVPAGAADLSMV